MHTYIHTHIHKYIHTYIHTYLHTYIKEIRNKANKTYDNITINASLN